MNSSINDHQSLAMLRRLSVVAFWLCVSTVYGQPPGGADRANAFVQSLSASQRASVLLPFYGLAPHEWSFYPSSLVFHDGVAVKDLDSIQKFYLYDFMKGYLSTAGYDRTRAIMDLEYVLKELQPESLNRIPENYYIAFYGTPHQDSIWGWTFQGHHVVLNYTIVKDKVAFTPFFFGSNPAEIKEGPSQGYRVIAAEEDIAYSLLNSFASEQRDMAIFQDHPFIEIVTFTSTQAAALSEVGIPVSKMNGVQKNLLTLLLTAYLSAMPDDLASARLQQLQSEDFESVRFGWAGSMQRGQPHYYRIQGKSFLVEFDNTQNNANHIHEVWRDFDGDFGRDLLLEHYQQEHRH